MSAAPTPRKLSRSVFWDHWVPGANKATEYHRQRGGPRRKKSEVTIGLHPLAGQPDLITIAAGTEQAAFGARHLCVPTWYCHANARQPVPVNDIMEPLIKQNGAVNDTVTYLGKAG
jgi:hypothetical protein